MGFPTLWQEVIFIGIFTPKRGADMMGWVWWLVMLKECQSKIRFFCYWSFSGLGFQSIP